MRSHHAKYWWIAVVLALAVAAIGRERNQLGVLLALSTMDTPKLTVAVSSSSTNNSTNNNTVNNRTNSGLDAVLDTPVPISNSSTDQNTRSGDTETESESETETETVPPKKTPQPKEEQPLFFPIRTKPVGNQSLEGYGSEATANGTETIPVTFLVLLSGEFANNLFKIVYGWGVAKMAAEEFGIASRLVFAMQVDRRNRVREKATRTARQLLRCLPYFRGIDLGLGNKLLNEGYFDEIDAKATGVPGFGLDKYLSLETSRKHLRVLADHLRGLGRDAVRKSTDSNTTSSHKDHHRVPVPMVRLDDMFSGYLDLYYDEVVKTLLAFDDEACCGSTLEAPPGPDESVLHYRNFGTEFARPDRRRKMGFEELPGDRIANELFANLESGGKLALAGRNLAKDSLKNNTGAHGLVEALRARNLTVRFSPGTAPSPTAPGDPAMEDFCFLKKARKELVGFAKSTYVAMASALGGPSIATTRLYTYTASDGSSRAQPRHAYQHPELAARIQYEDYYFDPKDRPA